MSTAEQVLAAMRSYGLKQIGRDQYQSNSPMRPGSDSMAFNLKIDGPEHGAWHDFVSGESGSLYQLASVLGVATPDSRPTVPDSKRMYSGLDDYAQAHGIPGDALRDAQWVETAKNGRRALQFRTRTGVRWRFLDGQKPVYISDNGYQRCWYGLNNHAQQLLNAGQPLVITNGEISTVAGQYHGIAAACVTSGEKELTDDLITELKNFLFGIPNVEILIALDCDATGRHVSRGIHAQLKAAGLSARAVDLGLGHAGDLADYCSLHQADTAKALLTLPDLQSELPPPTVKPRYQFYDLDALLNLPPVRWLVPGVIPERGLTVIYGHSGAGKSFYALDIALNVACEKPVTYVVAEGEGGMPARVGAWMKHHKKIPMFLNACLGIVNLFYDDDLQFFRDQVEKYKPVMMVVDTLAMCSSGADENNTKDMQRIVDACKRLADELDCSIVLVHHTNKQNQIRGSMTVYNSADTAIQLTKQGDFIEVKQRKSKDSREFEPLNLEQVTIGLGYEDDRGEEVTSLVLIPSDKVVADEAQLSVNQIAVINAMLVDPTASMADLALIADLSRSAVAGVIHRLLSRDIVQRDGQNALRLTPSGEKIYKQNIALSDSGDSGGVAPSKNENKKTGGAQAESPESPNQYALPGMPETKRNHYEMG